MLEKIRLKIIGRAGWAQIALPTVITRVNFSIKNRPIISLYFTQFHVSCVNSSILKSIIVKKKKHSKLCTDPIIWKYV